jgi:hypothetical protein
MRAYEVVTQLRRVERNPLRARVARVLNVLVTVAPTAMVVLAVELSQARPHPLCAGQCGWSFGVFALHLLVVPIGCAICAAAGVAAERYVSRQSRPGRIRGAVVGVVSGTACAYVFAFAAGANAPSDQRIAVAATAMIMVPLAAAYTCALAFATRD